MFRSLEANGAITFLPCSLLLQLNTSLNFSSPQLSRVLWDPKQKENPVTVSELQYKIQRKTPETRNRSHFQTKLRSFLLHRDNSSQPRQNKPFAYNIFSHHSDTSWEKTSVYSLIYLFLVQNATLSESNHQ